MKQIYVAGVDGDKHLAARSAKQIAEAIEELGSIGLAEAAKTSTMRYHKWRTKRMIKGWVAVIVGLIGLAFVGYTMYADGLGIAEMKRIRQDGYFYQGTSVVTAEQYDQIAKLNGFHGGTINVLSANPLTIDYTVCSLEYYPFIASKPWSFGDKFASGAGEVIPIIIAIICMMFVVLGFATIGSKQKGWSAKGGAA